MYFLTKDDDLLKEYNTIWDKFSANIYIKKNLITSLSTVKNIYKQK